MHFGRVEASISNRTIGGLTGSRSALALARVPVETTMRDRHRTWQKWALALALRPSLFAHTLTIYLLVAIPPLEPP